MMLRSSQLELITEKIMEWGNLVFVGLVIAQIVAVTSPFSFGIAPFGILTAVHAYLVAYFLMNGGAG